MALRIASSSGYDSITHYRKVATWFLLGKKIAAADDFKFLSTHTSASTCT
jgi:hypothetical protein